MQRHGPGHLHKTFGLMGNKTKLHNKKPPQRETRKPWNKMEVSLLPKSANIYSDTGLAINSIMAEDNKLFSRIQTFHILTLIRTRVERILNWLAAYLRDVFLASLWYFRTSLYCDGVWLAWAWCHSDHMSDDNSARRFLRFISLYFISIWSAINAVRKNTRSLKFAFLKRQKYLWTSF